MKSSVELYNEGYCYYTGTNMYPLNYQRAFEYFSQAAEMGYAEAMNYLGVIYDKGQLGKRNITLALEWYKKAANAGSPFAMVTLAIYYNEGKVLPRSPEKALALYKKAYSVDQNPHAGYYIACELMEEKKYIEAAKLFKQSGEKGNIPEAWHNLAYLIANHGIRLDKGADPRLQAALMYEKAAKLGYTPSMFNYAITVMQIAGGPNKEALKWLNKAAEMGYEPAKKRLKLLDFASSGSIFSLL